MIKSKRKVNKRELIQASLAIGDLRNGKESRCVRENPWTHVIVRESAGGVTHYFPIGSRVRPTDKGWWECEVIDYPQVLVDGHVKPI